MHALDCLHLRLLLARTPGLQPVFGEISMTET